MHTISLPLRSSRSILPGIRGAVEQAEIVFAGWALSSFALIAALWPLRETTLGKIGLIFLLLGGIGQTMGAPFDINHKLHGPAAMIGIPSLCIAAVLITLALARRPDISAPPMWSTLVGHTPWIINARHYQEYAVEHRFEGSTTLFSVTSRF